MPKRVVSVQNSCAAAFTANASARNYVAWSHYTLAVDHSDLGFVDYNWISTNAGETSNTNSFTVLGYQCQIGAISVTVLWSGSSTHIVAIDATNDESDVLLPAAFGLTKFAAGTIVMLKAIYDTGLLNGKIPASTYDKRAYTAITEQFQGYDPATCTVSSISATGSGFTATSGAFATVLNGNYRPILVGTPIVDGASMFWEGDSQVAGQGDVNGAGNFQYGIGVAQKSTPYGSGKLMPMTNFGRPGNTIAAITGAGNSKWRPICQYHTYFVFELGLNDANTGRTLAQIQADTMAILAIAKTYGCKTVVCTKTPITTGAYVLADGSDQVASPTPTPILDALNAWYYTQQTAGLIDYVIGYGEPVRNTTDSDKWKAPSITADGTHALVGGVNLQRDNGVVPFYNGLPTYGIDSLDSSITYGSSGTITTTGMATLTTMTIDGIAVAAINAPSGDGSWTFNSRVNGAIVPGIGSGKAVSIGDGTLTSTSTITVATPTGENLQTIASPVSTNSSYLNYWLTLANGWQVTMATAAAMGVANNQINANSQIVTDYVGSQTIWIWRSDTKVIMQATINKTAGGVITVTLGGGAGSISRYGITSSALTAR